MPHDLCTAVSQQLEMRLTAEMPGIINPLLDELQELGFDDKECFGIRLALEEALVNAVKHGNRADPSKRVLIRYQASLLQFSVEIEDEGPGFKPERVPDPLKPENLGRPSGRGVFLMHYYMTWVEYNEAGNCVTMYRRRN